MQVKLKAGRHTRKSFQWQIASTSISFVQARELGLARDGSSDGGCGGGEVAPHAPVRRSRTALRSGSRR